MEQSIAEILIRLCIYIPIFITVIVFCGMIASKILNHFNKFCDFEEKEKKKKNTFPDIFK